MMGTKNNRIIVTVVAILFVVGAVFLFTANKNKLGSGALNGQVSSLTEVYFDINLNDSYEEVKWIIESKDVEIIEDDEFNKVIYVTEEEREVNRVAIYFDSE